MSSGRIGSSVATCERIQREVWSGGSELRTTITEVRPQVPPPVPVAWKISAKPVELRYLLLGEAAVFYVSGDSDDGAPGLGVGGLIEPYTLADWVFVWEDKGGEALAEDDGVLARGHIFFAEAFALDHRDSQSVDENGASRRVRRRPISLLEPAPRLSVCSAKTHFWKNGRPK